MGVAPTAIRLSSWGGCVERVAPLWRMTHGLLPWETRFRRAPQGHYPFDTPLSERRWVAPL